MTIIQLLPGVSSLYAKAKVKPAVNYGVLENAMGGLYPYRLAAFNPPEFRMMAGWPVSIPDYDVRAQTLASCLGEVTTPGVTPPEITDDPEVIAERESPRAVVTGAVVRWIADSDNFDTTSLQWYPYQSSVDATWFTAVDFAPTFLADYEYRAGSERFYQDAINFDADSKEHMWTDLSRATGGATGYTVLMCVNLHSAFGDTGSAYEGLWSPGLPTPAGTDLFTETIDTGWASVKLKGQRLFVATDQTPDTASLAIADLLERSAPFYLAFVFGRPYTTIWAGAGPASMRSNRVFCGNEPVPFSPNVVLGRPTGTVLNSVDMSLLDLGIYADRLSAADLKTEVAKLTAIYGGDK